MAGQHQLVDLWSRVIPILPQAQLDSVSEFNWNFSNLEEAFAEGGVLHGEKVYLFVCTEIQEINFRGQSTVACIPVTVSPFPPSDKLGIRSMYNEEIIDMEEMNMDWVPWGATIEGLEPQIFILSRGQEIAELDQERREWCVPYFYNPVDQNRIQQSTIVDILYPIEPRHIICEFDWEMDELEELTNELIVGEELPEDHKDAFKEFVKEKVREGKRANREAREEWNRAREEVSQEEVAAFENMRFYKFYPVTTPDTPDVSSFKSQYINRYYGKAHQILRLESDDG